GLLPENPDEAFWWEVWLPVRSARQAVVSDFRKLAELAGCVVSEHQAEFPERTVLLMYGSQGQFTQSVMLLNCVAELRRAKDTAEFFDAMGVEEQGLWMNDMLAQAQFAPEGTDAPHAASSILASIEATRYLSPCSLSQICTRLIPRGESTTRRTMALAWQVLPHMET
ncbi:MAG: hypothetical protein WA970_24665, partial [Gammaproteobacteria bacterium]